LSEPQPTTEKRSRLYDLAERRVTVDDSMEAKDPIDQFLDQEDQRLVRTAKRLQMKTIIKDYEKELGTGEGEREGEEMPTQSTSVSPEMVKMFSGMSEEEREKAIDVYQRLTMVSSMKDMNPMMMPLILGTMKSNPTSSVAELASASAAMANTMKTGFDMARTQGQQPQYDPIALMKAAADLTRPAQAQSQASPASNPLEDAMQMISFFEEKGLLKKASDQPTPQTSDAMVQIELEKIRQQGETSRMETQIKLKELDLKWGTEQKKLDVEKAKADVFGEGITRVARAAGHAFGEGEEEGQAEAGATRASPQSAQTSPDIAYLPCEVCKNPPNQEVLNRIGGKPRDTQIAVPHPNVARIVTCPVCGSTYDYKPPAQ
jgi:rubrerythrin